MDETGTDLWRVNIGLANSQRRVAGASLPIYSHYQHQICHFNVLSTELIWRMRARIIQHKTIAVWAKRRTYIC